MMARFCQAEDLLRLNHIHWAEVLEPGKAVPIAIALAAPSLLISAAGVASEAAERASLMGWVRRMFVFALEGA